MPDKLPCRICDTPILPSTAQRNDGLCAPCYRKTPEGTERAEQNKKQKKKQLAAKRTSADRALAIALATVFLIAGFFIFGYLLFGLDYTDIMVVGDSYGSLLDKIVSGLGSLAYAITTPIRAVFDIPQSGASPIKILLFSVVAYMAMGIPLAVVFIFGELKKLLSRIRQK